MKTNKKFVAEIAPEGEGFAVRVWIDGLITVNFVATSMDVALQTTEAAARDARENDGLTVLESKVLAALKQQAQDCSGGDFAIVEEVSVRGLSRKGLGGVLGSLVAKGRIEVYPTMIVNRGTPDASRVTQVLIS